MHAADCELDIEASKEWNFTALTCVELLCVMCQHAMQSARGTGLHSQDTMGIGSMHGARLEWQLCELAASRMASKLSCWRADSEEHTCTWRARACHRAACMAAALHAAPDCWQPLVADAASSPSCTVSAWTVCMQAGGGVGTSRLSQQHQAPAGRAARKREPSPDSDFVIIV